MSAKSKEPAKQVIGNGVYYNTLLDKELSLKAEKYRKEKKIDSVQQIIRIVLNDFLNKNGY